MKFSLKLGKVIILLPIKNPWESLFESINQFSDDFMDTTDQPKQQEREDFFFMKYMLDTHICIYIIKKHPDNVLKKFKTRKKGTPIGSLDMMIAAHAHCMDLILVTNNKKE